MAYRVAIVDDSRTDAEFVQGILYSWARERQADIRAGIGITNQRETVIVWNKNTFFSIRWRKKLLWNGLHIFYFLIIR